MCAAAATLPASFGPTSPAPPSAGSMPVAVAIAIAAHTLLLLGLGIEMPEPAARPTRQLELMVVTQPGLESAAAVAALVAAQTDRAGETQALLPEVETLAADAPDSTALSGSDAPVNGIEQQAEPSEELAPTLATDSSPAPTDVPEPPQPIELAEPAPADPQPVSASLASAPLVTAASVDIEVDATPEPEVAEPEPEALEPRSLMTATDSELEQPSRPSISAVDIFASRNAEMANLAARIEERSQAYASRTRRKAISTATREYIYANYMEAWRRKVERIGNLNYPSEARELGLFGSLILHVAVRSDGSLEGIRVVRSSGHEVLDQAAVRIVELAAPFAPFPPNIKRETDVLDITRTWQFQRNHELGWGN